MFQILIKEFKEFFRDKTSVIFLILFPCLMVFLLGNLLQHLDNADSVIGDIHIAYTVEATDPVAVAAIDSFLDGLAEVENITLKAEEDLETAKQNAAEDAITAAVCFTQPLGIEVYEGSDSVKNSAVEAVFRSFSQTYSAVYTLASSQAQPADKSAADSNSLVVPKDLGVNRSMLDYYAVSMCAMVVFMGGISGAMAFLEEQKNHTLARLVITPKSRVSIYMQKILGTIPQAFLQVVAVMVSSTLLFGARYAATWQGNLLLFALFFSCSLAVIALCGILGLFVKANPMIYLMPPMWIIMFLSGTFSKEIFIEGVTTRMPVYLLQNAAFDLTVFGRTGRAAQFTLACIGIFVAAILAGALIFRRKGEKC